MYQVGRATNPRTDDPMFGDDLATAMAHAHEVCLDNRVIAVWKWNTGGRMWYAGSMRAMCTSEEERRMLDREGRLEAELAAECARTAEMQAEHEQLVGAIKALLGRLDGAQSYGLASVDIERP